MQIFSYRFNLLGSRTVQILPWCFNRGNKSASATGKRLYVYMSCVRSELCCAESHLDLKFSLACVAVVSFTSSFFFFKKQKRKKKHSSFLFSFSFFMPSRASSALGKETTVTPAIKVQLVSNPSEGSAKSQPLGWVEIRPVSSLTESVLVKYFFLVGVVNCGQLSLLQKPSGPWFGVGNRENPE